VQKGQFASYDNNMDLYSLIQNNKQVINTLYKAGAVNIKVLRHLEVYQFYLDALALGSKQAAIAFARDNFKITARHVYRSIEFMEQKLT